MGAKKWNNQHPSSFLTEKLEMSFAGWNKPVLSFFSRIKQFKEPNFSKSVFVYFMATHIYDTNMIFLTLFSVLNAKFCFKYSIYKLIKFYEESLIFYRINLILELLIHTKPFFGFSVALSYTTTLYINVCWTVKISLHFKICLCVITSKQFINLSLIKLNHMIKLYFIYENIFIYRLGKISEFFFKKNFESLLCCAQIFLKSS